MTLPRLAAMHEYWKENPPLHILKRVQMGIGEKKEEVTEDGLDDFARMTGAGVNKAPIPARYLE
jgi:hypothetical protein